MFNLNFNNNGYDNGLSGGLQGVFGSVLSATGNLLQQTFGGGAGGAQGYQQTTISQPGFSFFQQSSYNNQAGGYGLQQPFGYGYPQGLQQQPATVIARTTQQTVYQSAPVQQPSGGVVVVRSL